MPDLAALAERIKTWSRELGFQQLGVAGIELGEDAAHLRRWLDEGLHGRMEYMARHGDLRARPEELVPGTLRVLGEDTRLTVAPTGPVTGRVTVLPALGGTVSADLTAVRRML